jgi:Flp pilus assembly protein TadD
LDTTKARIAASLAAAAIFALLVASTAEAGDAAARQASEQVERGYTAAKDGYWQEALFRFERANALTPNQPRILNNIAVSLEAAGRFEEALSAYESALGIAPNDQVLRRNYSRFKEFYEAQLKSTPDAAEETAGGKPAGPQPPGAEEKDDA